MADQLDRDYELLSYNTHPAQLFIYELRNNFIRQTNEEADQVEKGQDTIFTAFAAELECFFCLLKKISQVRGKKIGPWRKTFALKTHRNLR